MSVTTPSDVIQAATRGAVQDVTAHGVGHEVYNKVEGLTWSRVDWQSGLINRRVAEAIDRATNLAAAIYSPHLYRESLQAISLSQKEPDLPC